VSFFKTSFGACSARLDTKTFASHSLHCPSCSIRSDCTPELIRTRAIKICLPLLVRNRGGARTKPLNFQDAAKAPLRRDDQTLPTRRNPCTHHRRTWTGLRPSYLQLIATGYSPCSLNLQSQLQDRGMSLCTVPKGGCRAMRHSFQLCFHEQSFGLEHFSWRYEDEIGARWSCLKRAGYE
jgi:hypothetical protein